MYLKTNFSISNFQCEIWFGPNVNKFRQPCLGKHLSKVSGTESERGRGVKSEKSQRAISTLKSCVADSLVTQPSHIRGMTENTLA